MDYPRVAVVGAGSLSTRRIYPYLGAAGARLVGVCDLDQERARRNALLFGGESFTDLVTMLDTVTPDAVIICVGPEGHASLARQVLGRGLPVYTEKPPAVSAAAALATARVAAETGLLCVTAFKKRYTAAANRARAFLADFAPAERYLLSIDYASAPFAEDVPRRQFLLDFCVHVIDLARYLFGEVEEVVDFAVGTNAHAISLRFAGGAAGTLSLTSGRCTSHPTEEIELTCAGGCWMSIHNSSVWTIGRERQVVEYREPPTYVSAGDSGYDTGHLAELEDFVTAVRTGRGDSRSAIADGYRSMVVYEAIAASAATGRPVRPVYETI